MVKNCRHELTIDFATEEKFSAWRVFGVARWGVYKKEKILFVIIATIYYYYYYYYIFLYLLMMILFIIA